MKPTLTLPFKIPVAPVALLGVLSYLVLPFLWDTSSASGRWLVVDVIAQVFTLAVVGEAVLHKSWTSQHIILLVGLVGVAAGHWQKWSPGDGRWFLFDGMIASGWFPSVWEVL